MCNELLRTSYISSFQIYLTGKTDSSIMSILICHGSVIEQNFEDEFFLVLFNKQIYFFISHFLLIIWALIMKSLKFQNKEYIFNLILFSIFVNLFFNYPLGLNLVNELIINQLVILFVLIIPVKSHEN